MKAVALYCRVSTREQVNGYSIDEQIDRLKLYAESQGWKDIKLFVDPGFSGASMNRPALQELILEVKDGKIQKVVVYKLDRLSRSQKDTLELIEDVFLANNCDFESMSERFDTGTPFGNAMIGILAVFAQLERETIKERTMMGKEARVKAGLRINSGFAPIGYDQREGHLYINEYEASLVRELFESYCKGLSLNEVIRDFNDKGLVTKYGEWNRLRVFRILRNPLYNGKLLHNGEVWDGEHEAIISDELWNKTQKRIESAPTYTRAKGRKALLGGLLRCKRCGATYSTKSWIVKGERVRSYCCNSRRKSAPQLIRDPNCKNDNWREDVLDALIWDELNKLSLDESLIYNMTEEPSEQNDRSASLAHEMAQIDVKRMKLLDLYTEGTFSASELSEKVDQLNIQKQKLSDELEKIENKKSRIEKDEAVLLIRTLNDVRDNGTTDDQRLLISSLIDLIEIDGQDVYIHWSF